MTRPSNETHLHDGQIIAIINGELAVKDSAKAHAHLDTCWKCLARKEQLESAIFRLVHYRKELLAPYLPPPPGGEDRFIARLDQQIDAMQRSSWTRLLSQIRSLPIPGIKPAYAVTFAAAAAAVLLVFLWDRNAPTVSAHVFMEKAVQSESVAGIIHQRIEIKTKSKTLQRSLYRDAARKRTPRASKPKPDEEQLRNELETAGVDWQEPLSPMKFQSWHDRLAEKTDEVRNAGPGTLMLITSAADGDVKESSISVRTADFHPVARRILMRSSEEIEISEINYDVLSWDAVNVGSLFEAVALPPVVTTEHHEPPAHQPAPDSLEAELAVRYSLHGVGADLGEPIEVRGSTVSGIVASDERKREILAALVRIPHMTAQLQTEEEASQARPARQGPVRTTEPLIVALRSPIEKELLEYFGNAAALENFSKQALTLAETVMTRASALHQLSERYRAPLSPRAHQLLQEMRRDHRQAMSAAISELAALLRPVLQSVAVAAPESTAKQSLFANAQQVQRLTLELLSGSGSQNANASAKSVQDLLAALRSLETSLEEQQ